MVFVIVFVVIVVYYVAFALFRVICRPLSKIVSYVIYNPIAVLAVVVLIGMWIAQTPNGSSAPSERNAVVTVLSEYMRASVRAVLLGTTLGIKTASTVSRVFIPDRAGPTMIERFPDSMGRIWNWTEPSSERLCGESAYPTVPCVVAQVWTEATDRARCLLLALDPPTISKRIHELVDVTAAGMRTVVWNNRTADSVGLIHRTIELLVVDKRSPFVELARAFSRLITASAPEIDVFRGDVSEIWRNFTSSMFGEETSTKSREPIVETTERTE